MQIEEMREEVERLAVCKYFRAFTQKTEEEWFRIFRNKTVEQLRDAVSAYVSKNDEFPAPSEILALIEKKERPKPENIEAYECDTCYGTGRILVEFPHGSLCFGCDCPIGRYKYPSDKRGFEGLRDPWDINYYMGEELAPEEIEYQPVPGKPVWIAVNKKEEARKRKWKVEASFRALEEAIKEEEAKA